MTSTTVAGSKERGDFVLTFGRKPMIRARAPGRLNLIGEHTDYTEGFVLPAAIDMETVVLAAPRDDNILHVCSQTLSLEDQVDLGRLSPESGAEWTRYVRGVAALLMTSGHKVLGADLSISGNLPIGSGLSSSASLTVAVTLALLGLTDGTIDPVDLAVLCSRVENEIVGVQSGLMDQLAVIYGVEDSVLLIDCRSRTVDPVSVPDSVAFLVLDTGVRRGLADTGYNLRRDECHSALMKIRAFDHPEVQNLRDVTPEILDQCLRGLSDVEFRRVRHVVGENARVLAAADALSSHDVKEVGRLMDDSHASLRDDFEVSGPELDAMVALAREEDGVFGARLTGAGFGGCAIALVEKEASQAAAGSIRAGYERATGKQARAYVCRPGNGASIGRLETASSTETDRNP